MAEGFDSAIAAVESYAPRVVNWEKLAAALRAVLTFRYGVLGYVALIVIATLVALLVAIKLGASVLPIVLLFSVFFIGILAVLFIAQKMPQLVLMGGPELPPPARITAITDLLYPKPARPEDRVIETDSATPAARITSDRYCQR